LVLATTLMGWSSPASAGPASWPTIDLPPWPGSSFAQRLAGHQAEARRPAHVADGSTDPTLQAKMSMSQTFADFANMPKPKWWIEHQDMVVSVIASKARIKVENTLTVRSKKGTSIDRLNLRTDLLDEKLISVHDAKGAKLPFTYKVQGVTYANLEVTLPAPMTEDVDTKMFLQYEATLDCNSKKYMLKMCTFDSYFQSVMFFRYYVSHGDVLHAPFRSDLHVVTAPGFVVASPGIPSGPDKLSNGSIVWHFKQLERTQNGGFTIAKYKVVGDKVPVDPSPLQPFVRVYSIGKWANNASTMLEQTKKILGFHATRYGSYPWSGLNVIQNAKDFGGGYAPLSGIFMARNMFGASKGSWGWTAMNELLAHEVAHQWWGNLSRPKQSGDVSLSEALAEFSSCLYTEKSLDSRQQIVGDNLSYLYTVPAEQDVPLAAQHVTSSPKYVPIVYHKGAVVFDMLRIELGEQVFVDALAQYSKKFARDYVEIEDMFDVLEAVSGRKLGWYFQQWFKSKGAIHVQITGRVEKNKEGGWLARLRVATLGSTVMRFKLPVRVTFGDGTQENTTIDVIPQQGKSVTVAEAVFAKQPRALRLDLGRRLLRRFEVLTKGDVDLNGLTDGGDLVEMAFRKGRTVVARNNQGNKYFYPNQGWDELFDIERDDDHIVNEKDIDQVVAHIGEEAINF
jgi:hypothetical protein